MDLQALALAQPPRDNVRQTFTALNGLRILAALLVVLFHYGALTDSFVDFPIFVRNFIHNGTIALPFFYALSGFVLTQAYSGLSYTTLRTREFYSARIARLFPAYLLGFILFLPIGPLFHKPGTVQAGPSRSRRSSTSCFRLYRRGY